MKRLFRAIFVLLLPSLGLSESIPVVLWHGMGDSCCNPLSMGSVKSLIHEELPGTYVKSLMIGENVVEDVENGFFMGINEQIDLVCKRIKTDEQLKNGYNAIGFSQGGQFLRAVAQRCPQGMRKLISIGGQHQGVFGFPHCIGEQHEFCEYVRRLLSYGAYTSWVQRLLVQAQYWHDPLREDVYKNRSLFMADINNENKVDEKYKDNLNSLKLFVMVKFNNDTMVDPKESQHFGFYKTGSTRETETLEESLLYTQDRLGLQKMNENQKLVFISVNGDHLKMPQGFFENEIIKKYLKD